MKSMSFLIRSSLEFASNLDNRLRCREDLSALAAELYKYIDELSLESIPVPTESCYDIDGWGTRLWNLTSKLRQGSLAGGQLKGDQSQSAQLLCLGLKLNRQRRLFCLICASPSLLMPSYRLRTTVRRSLQKTSAMSFTRAFHTQLTSPRYHTSSRIDSKDD